MQKIPSSSLGGDTNPWKDCIRKSNWYKKLCQIKIFSSIHCSQYEISRIRVSVICITFHIVYCQPCDRLAPVQVVPRLLPYGIGVNPELDKWMDGWLTAVGCALPSDFKAENSLNVGLLVFSFDIQALSKPSEFHQFCYGIRIFNMFC